MIFWRKYFFLFLSDYIENNWPSLDSYLVVDKTFGSVDVTFMRYQKSIFDIWLETFWKSKHFFQTSGLQNKS